MKTAQPKSVFVLGHWNDDSSGCSSNMAVPEVYSTISKYPGCDIGDKLKYFDGHVHCNTMQGKGVKEEVGFMIGGHGMDGCGQYGFNYVDSTGGTLKIYYFEERTETTDSYQEILDCVKANKTVSDCTHLATLWLETKL